MENKKKVAKRQRTENFGEGERRMEWKKLDRRVKRVLSNFGRSLC